MQGGIEGANQSAVNVETAAGNTAAIHGHGDVVPLAVGDEGRSGIVGTGGAGKAGADVRTNTIGELEGEQAVAQEEGVALNGGGFDAFVEDELDAAGVAGSDPGVNREIALAKVQGGMIGDFDVVVLAIEAEGAVDLARNGARAVEVGAVGGEAGDVKRRGSRRFRPGATRRSSQRAVSRTQAWRSRAVAVAVAVGVGFVTSPH